MKIVKLDSSHSDMVEHLFFENQKYMEEEFKYNYEYRFIHYKQFCDSYLSDLPNHHAYGIIEDDEVKTFISFYESVEEPSWYFTMVRSDGSNGPKNTEYLLDKVVEHNENRGRYKFYCAMNKRHTNKRITRKFGFSKYVDERYDFFDEYLVEKHTMPPYNHHYEILFNRSLLPVDFVIRCTFLKQQYRKL